MKFSPRTLLFPVFPLLLAAAGCSILPGELGLQSVEEDRKMGAQLAQQVREQIGILEKRKERLRRYVTWCNRGGELVGRDDAGLKHNVSCSGVRRELESLQADLASARAYLEDGLEEECRRAGCLPGWIR